MASKSYKKTGNSMKKTTNKSHKKKRSKSLKKKSKRGGADGDDSKIMSPEELEKIEYMTGETEQNLWQKEKEKREEHLKEKGEWKAPVWGPEGTKTMLQAYPTTTTK